jgi:dihydrofolate reductase
MQTHKPIHLIVAQDKNSVIGHGPKVPKWGVTDDYGLNFVPKTMGCAIIMGGNTARSFKQALEGRICIAISRDKTLETKGFIVVDNLWEALAIAHKAAGDIVWICGGDQIYQLALKHLVIEELHITTIEAEYPADNAIKFSGFDSNLYEVDLSQSVYFEKRPPKAKDEKDKGNKESARVEVYKYNPVA